MKLGEAGWEWAGRCGGTWQELAGCQVFKLRASIIGARACSPFSTHRCQPRRQQVLMKNGGCEQEGMCG